MTRRDERGAVAAITAIMLATIVGMAAFAVDLGMQRVVRSDMQALADVVALDAARLLDGRTAGEIRAGTGDPDPLASVVTASAARHSTLGEIDEVTADLVYLAVGPHGEQVPRRDPTGDLVPVPDDQLPEAVYVVASGSVDFSFTPGSGGATRSALGIASSAACFTIGSYAASVDPASSAMYGDLLKPLIGTTTLGLVGYPGLATASISLLDIVSAPSIGLGSVDEILNAPNVTVANFYLAMARALEGEGKVAEAAVLQSAATSAVATFTIDLGDLIGLTTASDAVLEARFNALDLLVGAAFLANGDHLAGLPNLQAELPSVGVTNTELTIIERPQRACDDDEAQTAQVRFTSDISLSLDNSPLINTRTIRLRMVDPVTGNPDNDPDLALNAYVAGARASLVSVTCDPDVFTASVSTDLTTIRLTGSIHVRGEAEATITVGGLPVEVQIPVRFDVTLLADGSRPASSTPTTVVFDVPPRAYGDRVPAPAGDTVLPALTVQMDPATLQTGPLSVGGVPISTSVLDAAVAPLVANVPTLINGKVAPLTTPLVAKINSVLLAVTKGAGISLAGADFAGLDHPLCSAPRLRG